MGIDTKDRRKSVVNWFLRLLPSPDTIIDTADRAHIGGLYRGLFAALSSISVKTDLLILGEKIKAFTSDIILSLSQIATHDRRKSVTNSIVRILPFPDGTIDMEDRRHVAGFYRHINSLTYDLGISADLLIGELDIIKSVTSDLLIKEIDSVISVTTDLLTKKLNAEVFTTSDLLILIEIIKSTTSDLLISTRNIRSLTSDLLVRKLDNIVSATVDIIISIDVRKERIYLKSYINTTESDNSTINTLMNEDSKISKNISKFSETDSSISVSRYSIINLTQEV